MNRRFVWIVGPGIGACAAGFLVEPGAMLRSYLFAWLFALGLSLGALANLMVHTLTGGRWGEALRPALLAATRALPLVTVLYLPLLLGHRLLYPESGTLLCALRAVAYLALWNLLAAFWLRAQQRGHAAAVSAGGLVLYAFTMSIAAFDWIVALEPGWYSSGFGLVVGIGQMLTGAAFGVAAAFFLKSGPQGDAARRACFHDLGNLLLMYVLTWAYLAFTQFLIIWAENLPRETSWYLPRLQTSWFWLGAALVVFHFFVPLAILLSRAAKRSPRFLSVLAAGLVLAQLADISWLVLPGFRRDGFALAWTDFAALAGIGALWGAAWHRGIEPWMRTFILAR